MTSFDKFRALPQFQNLEPVPAAKLETIRRDYPGIPEDYLAFLERVGAGSIGAGKFADFKLYSGPVEPGEVYDPETAKALTDLLLVGDDFQGYCTAVSRSRGWIVVDIDPTSPEEALTMAPFATSVVDYLWDQCGPDED